MPVPDRHKTALPPILREMSSLRALGVRRLALQALLVGGISGGVIGAFRLSYDVISEAVAQAVRHHGFGPVAGPLALMGALLLLAVAAWALLRYEPLISGSGIPQVELAIAGRGPMPWRRVLWAKFAGTLVSLTGGLSVGREGPCIQMGAAVGCWVGRIWNDENQQSLPRYLIGGSVAGLTAAFGAPLAGMFFAFEEVKALISVPLLLFTGLAAASACFVVDVLFGFGLVLPFRHMESLALAQWWLPPALGLAMGLLGAAYNGLLLGMTRALDALRSLPLFLRVLAPFLLSGALLVLYPQVLSGFGPEITRLEDQPLSLGPLFFLLAAKILHACFSFASTVAGGLLMPMLYVGGLAGALAAALCAGPELIGPGQSSCLTALCMAGLFAATVRAPLTGSALILEMTGAWPLAPAVVVAAYVAAFTASALRSGPVYESLKKRILLQRRGQERPAGNGPDGESTSPGAPVPKAATQAADPKEASHGQ